jgi:hypothetical protein
MIFSGERSLGGHVFEMGRAANAGGDLKAG